MRVVCFTPNILGYIASFFNYFFYFQLLIGIFNQEIVSETVGVAERVLCPVRCVANAFSCVLSGWWQTTIIAVQTASAVLTAGCFVMLLVSKTKKKEN